MTRLEAFGYVALVALIFGCVALGYWMGPA